MEKEKILKRKKEAVREDRKWDVVMDGKNKGKRKHLSCPLSIGKEKLNETIKN